MSCFACTNSSREQQFRVQLNLQISYGCNQNATYESVRQQLLANFSNLPYFEVYFHGFGTQLWYLDTKVDSGVSSTGEWFRDTIGRTILPAFEECLQLNDQNSFCEWLKKRGCTNRDWMKITEDNEPFPGVPPHIWGVISDGDELPDFTQD